MRGSFSEKRGIMTEQDEVEKAAWAEYVELVKLQGLIHEEAAKKEIGGDAGILDETASQGLRGGRYPTYDIASSEEIASVKSHSIADGQVSEQTVGAYLRDFDKVLGWDRGYERGLSPLQQDAERIATIRDQGIPVPEQLREASEDEIKEYLKHNSTLRIPDDHVEPVRESLETKIREIPGNYHLPEDPTDEEVTSVTSRIKGTGLTSSEAVQRMESSAEYKRIVEKSERQAEQSTEAAGRSESENRDHSQSHEH